MFWENELLFWGGKKNHFIFWWNHFIIIIIIFFNVFFTYPLYTTETRRMIQNDSRIIPSTQCSDKYFVRVQLDNIWHKNNWATLNLWRYLVMWHVQLATKPHLSGLASPLFAWKHSNRNLKKCVNCTSGQMKLESSRHAYCMIPQHSEINGACSISQHASCSSNWFPLLIDFFFLNSIWKGNAFKKKKRNWKVWLFYINIRILWE